MAKYEVTGTRKVAGVAPGGTVDLDPERVDITALETAGHVKLAKKTPRASTAPTEGENE